MSNNPGNSKKMYTSTPLRNNANCGNNSCHGMQFRSTDDEDVIEIGHNQRFYSIPRATCNNSTNISDNNNEFQSLSGADTYNSVYNTMPELLNEDESDTDESYANYKTPETSYLKSKYSRPICFENACSNQNSIKSKSKSNATEDSGYMNILSNLKEYCKPSTSSAVYSNDSSTICSQNKKFIMGNSMEYTNLEKYAESEDEEELDDFPKMPNVSKDSYYVNHVRWNLNCDHDDKCEKIVKPHASLEKYPCSTPPLKKTRRMPNIIKEDDYQQQIPPFVQSSESMDLTNISCCSDERTPPSNYLKYSPKQDLSAKSDSINMLSVVISTVMLLASKSQVPQNYITWTLKYLKCIRNNQGEYPPNIKKIQKMLTLPTGTGQEQWQHMDYIAERNLAKRINLTKQQRKSNN